MNATGEDGVTIEPVWLLRRSQLIALLQVLNEGLPELSRRDHSTSGFVNEGRSRTCPDCLANGRVMFGCETCHGSGEVSARHVDAIAVPDAFPDDGQLRDPYAVSETVQPYGVASTAKLGHVSARDAELDRMRLQTRAPFASFDDEIADANIHPYLWERERDALRRRYDIDAMTVALDSLRDADPAGYSILHGVYVYGVSEPATSVEAIVERALVFLDERMPRPMRAPGDRKHQALARRDRKAA